jgi:hypothetical protein
VDANLQRALAYTLAIHQPIALLALPWDWGCGCSCFRCPHCAGPCSWLPYPLRCCWCWRRLPRRHWWWPPRRGRLGEAPKASGPEIPLSPPCPPVTSNPPPPAFPRSCSSR